MNVPVLSPDRVSLPSPVGGSPTFFRAGILSPWILPQPQFLPNVDAVFYIRKFVHPNSQMLLLLVVNHSIILYRVESIPDNNSNSSATLVEIIPFDNNDEINTGIEGYGLYENDAGIRFNVVTYRDPETRQLHQFISTLPESINPGTIAILYYKRWTIEKVFNNSKSDFKETKAWSSNVHSLRNQMRLTAMSYNLMRVFEEMSKRQKPE